MKTFEIYFSDLTEPAQKSVLDFVGAESATDSDYDMYLTSILPMATFSIDDDEEEEEE